MAKKDRTGNRKTREQKKQFKVPELGYYLIVTDTEATERCFFNGLHQEECAPICRAVHQQSNRKYLYSAECIVSPDSC